MSNEQVGFTLIELIMTMIIIGVIGAIAAPRFFDNDVFQSRGFADQVQATLRYAQKVAIAQRRTVCVNFDLAAIPNTVTLMIDSDPPRDGVCNAAPAGDLQSPAGAPAYQIQAPNGIAFDTATPPINFAFDSLGVAAPTQTIQIAGVANGIVIEPGTGYVHSP